MPPNLWLTIVAASSALLLIPGPTRIGGLAQIAMGAAAAILRRPPA